MSYDLSALTNFAYNYQFKLKNLPVSFGDEPYTRVSISRDDDMEIVLICFREGQTSSVHNHQGSNCVIRVVNGKLLETLYKEEDPGELSFYHQHYLRKGDISGLDGEAIHQLTNLSKTGTVLLNFYSPPFDMNMDSSSDSGS
jgi:cysteine dioxygenase